MLLTSLMLFVSATPPSQHLLTASERTFTADTRSVELRELDERIRRAPTGWAEGTKGTAIALWVSSGVLLSGGLAMAVGAVLGTAFGPRLLLSIFALLTLTTGGLLMLGAIFATIAGVAEAGLRDHRRDELLRQREELLEQEQRVVPPEYPSVSRQVLPPLFAVAF